MKSLIIKMLILLLLFSTGVAFAQSTPPPPSPPPGFPIDTILYILAGTGIGYGIYKKKK